MDATLRKNPMMAHLLQALESGTSIGHYGRLVFTMVARFFMKDSELVSWLVKDPECDTGEARAMLLQVQEHEYTPPTRETILEFQSHQEFPIIPNPHDPEAGNVYKDLRFPVPVYKHIEEYYEEKAAAKDES